MTTTLTVRNRRLEGFVPPEGVPIHFDIATIGARFGAQTLDFLITGTGVGLFMLGLVWTDLLDWTALVTLMSLVFFFARVPYYVFSELVWNGRTLGKRIVRIRVISANGRRLTPQQIVVRNLMKEVEIFSPLPMFFTMGTGGLVSSLLSVLWLLVILIVPLANRRRQRLGDMVAGTLVVDNPRPALLPDLAGGDMSRARFAFQRAHLDIYGRYELQTLEEILRDKRPEHEMEAEIAAITEAVLRKIAYPEKIPPSQRLDFLHAFYRAQREHLETQQLFGDRRADKFHARPPADPG